MWRVQTQGTNRTALMTCTSKCFSVIYFNCRSLLPKIDELRANCATYCPDVVCLVETWLCSDIINSELYIPNYNVFRLDRNRNGGGVAMFIHKSIHFNILLLGPLGLEFVLVTYYW